MPLSSNSSSSSWKSVDEYKIGEDGFAAGVPEIIGDSFCFFFRIVDRAAKNLLVATILIYIHEQYRAI